MNDIYAVPSLPASLRANVTESELSFVVPIDRENHVINPSFELDNYGESYPYNWDSGIYSEEYNTILTQSSMGSVVSENVYRGSKSFRVNMTNTDDYLVYGINQPISVPLASNRDEIDNGVYNIQGALSFYVFAPAVTAISPFSIFNQSAHTSHDIVVNIYANIDANGNPTGEFNIQDVLTSATVSIYVDDGNFFDNDIEPNVIGRRKTPEWQRVVVNFNAKYTEGITTFLRFSIANSSIYSANPQPFVFYLDAVQVEFFDDIFSYETTYLDGDVGQYENIYTNGYSWRGKPHRSISHRTTLATTGGVVFNLQKDFNFNTLSIEGLGLPTPVNTIEPFIFTDGQQFVSSGIDSRKITVSGYVTNGSYLETFRSAGKLQYFLSNQVIGDKNVRRFFFRIPNSCTTASRYVYFNAIVENFTVEPVSENPVIQVSIELNNLDIYFHADNYAYSTSYNLSPEQSLDNYNIILFNTQGGSPVQRYNTEYAELDVNVPQSFFGYESYSLTADNFVNCYLELQNGNILLGGYFNFVTYTINGEATVVECKKIALLKTDGTVIPIRDLNRINDANLYNYYNGVSGPSSRIEAMIQTNDGAIMIAGKFSSVAGRTYDCTNICYLNKIDEDGNIVGNNRDVEGGLIKTSTTGYVKSLVYSRDLNTIYVGGDFSQAVNSNNSKSIQLRNIAIYSINQQYKWSQLHYGANGIVNTLAIQNQSLFIGGAFTALYSDTSTTPYTQTGRAAIYSLNPSIEEANKVKGLASTSTIKKGALGARNSTFNNTVNKIAVSNLGEIIIGGTFTSIDLNENNFPSTALQSIEAKNIVIWNNFSTFKLMGNVKGTSTSVSFNTTEVLDIYAAPYNNDVYVVGKFATIGDLGSSICVARWNTNRWEALNFELHVEEIHSVFVSKNGYGFLSTKSSVNNTLNNKYLPYPIVVENPGLESQFSIELYNPISNNSIADIVSIYNVTTNKSISFNLQIYIDETISIDFTKDVIRPISNIRGRIINSIVGGGTFSNFFLANGKNILYILGGCRDSNGDFIAPITITIRYESIYSTPVLLYESSAQPVQPLIGWEIGLARLGLDTRVMEDITVMYPDITINPFTLDETTMGIDSVVLE